jgi:hypothetical protein
MVAGVLRFCWQDDTLGGRKARPRSVASAAPHGGLPLTCSFAPQLCSARVAVEDFSTNLATTVDSRVITVV